MDNLIVPYKIKPSVVVSLSVPLRQEPGFELPTRAAISLPRKSLDIRLNALCQEGCLSEAVEALQSMTQTGFKVRRNTFINLLERCISENSVQLGRRLHSMVDLVENVDAFVETKLVSMYAKCGFLEDSQKVFEGMRERNLYSWSAMIGALSREKRWRDVVELFSLMMVKDGLLPDDFLFPKILQACGNCADFDSGKLMHSLIIRSGLNRYIRVSNSILAVYAKCGKLSLARRVFDSMDERDVVTWNSLISGYCQKGQNEEAHRLIDVMQAEGIDPGLVTWNVLIAGYSQSGNCDIAVELLKKIEDLGLVPDVFTWTSVISGFAQNGRPIQSLDLFREMLLRGVEPNGVTITSAVSACASVPTLNKGEEVHSIAVKIGLANNMLVGNALIDMYSKCGDLESAQKVFNVLLEKDIYSWNSMIGGYLQAGYCGQAHELFLKMQEESDVRPNVITWNIMVSGYMQNGAEDQAINLFQQMEGEGKVQPNTATWNSIIARYAQVREKDRALGVFKQMQSFGISPNWVTILSVLPSCENLVAAKKVKEIHCYVVRHNLIAVLPVANSLVDTYAKSGNIEYSRAVFDGIFSKDIISWNSIIGGYVLHGRPRPALDLFDDLKKLGFKPNRGTFVAVITACGQAGMVNEGSQIFSRITKDYQIIPAVEHFLSMVELYGRAGRLEEALEFVQQMPIEPESSIWLALLSGCRIHRDSGLASIVLEQLLEPELEHALKLKRHEKENTTRKTLGQSWTEIKNTVHSFVSDPSESKSYSAHLHSWIHDIENTVGALQSPELELQIEEEEKEEIGLVHSEKIAIAFSLISQNCSPPQSIRIMKNIRMCEDCHRFAKYISLSHNSEIYLSDTKCLHHFKEGKCSCGDYW